MYWVFTPYFHKEQTFMITHYGKDNFTFLIIVGIVFGIGANLTHILWLQVLLYIPAIIIIAFALWFFRDPKRIIPQEALDDDSILLAPADGKVVQVIETHDKHFLKGPALQVSIFLSPLDVHVNRIPSNGTIGFVKYFPGKYLVAFNHKASEENEQSVIGIENSAGKYTFKQITGFLARRIVFDVKEGDTVQAGDQYGMMKFGSRMDILLPMGTTINVHEGQTVRGGETLMAQLQPMTAS
jgi:phosphatidylserine decarboxylase